MNIIELKEKMREGDRVRWEKGDHLNNTWFNVHVNKKGEFSLENDVYDEPTSTNMLKNTWEIEPREIIVEFQRWGATDQKYYMAVKSSEDIKENIKYKMREVEV